MADKIKVIKYSIAKILHNCDKVFFNRTIDGFRIKTLKKLTIINAAIIKTAIIGIKIKNKVVLVITIHEANKIKGITYSIAKILHNSDEVFFNCTFEDLHIETLKKTAIIGLNIKNKIINVISKKKLISALPPVTISPIQNKTMQIPTRAIWVIIDKIIYTAGLAPLLKKVFIVNIMVPIFLSEIKLLSNIDQGD